MMVKFACLCTKHMYNAVPAGGVAEWSKAPVLKTGEREFPGFESLPLRHYSSSLSYNISLYSFILLSLYLTSYKKFLRNSFSST